MIGLSVARSLRSTIEQVSGEVPDIIMLIIGIAIFVWAFSAVFGAAQQVKGLISGL